MRGFNPDEMLYRAVKPAGMYWKEDGSVSSAAFWDSHGLSVDRLGDRSESEAVDVLAKAKEESSIVAVTYQNCRDIDAVVKYLPLPDNMYHSEVHGGDYDVELTKAQRKVLASRAVVKLRFIRKKEL